eukprot:1195705-Prorocentrum_minimum.AAC.1
MFRGVPPPLLDGLVALSVRKEVNKHDAVVKFKKRGRGCCATHFGPCCVAPSRALFDAVCVCVCVCVRPLCRCAGTDAAVGWAPGWRFDAPDVPAAGGGAAAGGPEGTPADHARPRRLLRRCHLRLRREAIRHGGLYILSPLLRFAKSFIACPPFAPFPPLPPAPAPRAGPESDLPAGGLESESGSDRMFIAAQARALCPSRL